MRRALGLDAGASTARPAAIRPTDSHNSHSSHTQAPRHRHRFVNDGEVPVVMVHSRPDQPPPSRPDRSSAQLDLERAARERAERALAAAQTRIRDLDTKLHHLTLARDEALAALDQLREQLAAALARPAAAPAAAPIGDQTGAATAASASAQADSAAAPVTRRRGRPPKPKTERPAPKPRGKAPQPVKWWVKGWRESVTD